MIGRKDLMCFVLFYFILFYFIVVERHVYTSLFVKVISVILSFYLLFLLLFLCISVYLFLFISILFQLLLRLLQHLQLPQSLRFNLQLRSQCLFLPLIPQTIRKLLSRMTTRISPPQQLIIPATPHINMIIN